ncbi:MAG TPA: AgmX/PglI C-terminal domain-containing protein [Polyangia bacterium]|jgi:hypothetical protein
MDFVRDDFGRCRRLALAMVLSGGALLVTRSAAAGDGGAGGAGDALAPAKLLAGPSLSETGKVGRSKLEGEAPAASMRAAPKLKARPEPPVAASDTAMPPSSPPPAKVPLPRAVQQQVAVHLRGLKDCRGTVARDKHVPAAQVPAGSLQLRWTINADGSVAAAEVVEKTAVDPAVMECARQTIAKWTFPLPDQGPLHVERRYRFPAPK